MKRLSLAFLALLGAVLAIVWWQGESNPRGERGAQESFRESDGGSAPSSIELEPPSLEPARIPESEAQRSVPGEARTERAPEPAATRNLPAGFALRGSVRNDRDELMDGCEVFARPEDLGLEEEWNPRREHAVRGGFRFDNLQPGHWVVYASSSEGVTAHKRVQIGADQSYRDSVMDLRFVRRVRVSGVVLDPENHALASACVHAISDTSDFYGRGQIRSQNCDDEGFALDDLQAGPIVLQASCKGWADSESLRLELAPGEERAELVLRVRREARLTGELLGPDDAPLAKVDVALNGAFQAKGSTDALGRFAFEHLPPGGYTFQHISQVQGDGTSVRRQVSLARFELGEAEQKHLVLRCPAATDVRVYGAVGRGGAPCSDATVNSGFESTRTNQDGFYALRLPGGGALRFGISVAGGATTWFSREVPARGEVELDFELPGGELSGRILGLGGEGVSEASIMLQGAPDAWPPAPSLGFARLSRNGAFRLGSIAPGSYTLTVNPLWNSRRDLAPVEHRFTLGIDESIELELVLPRATCLHGTVLTPDGVVFPGAEIVAFDERHRSSRASSSQDGDFNLGPLAAGRYSVLAHTAELCSAWHEVAVGNDQAPEIALVLAPATRVEIRVQDGNGQPLEARFIIQDSEGRGFEALDDSGARLDSPSSSTVRRLPPGDYRITAIARTLPLHCIQPLRIVGQAEELVQIVLERP